MILFSKFAYNVAFSFAAVLSIATAASAQAQTTSIETEYLMTLYAPLAAPQDAGDLKIFNVIEGGWAKGPKIEGKVIAPAADWFRLRPDGSGTLDVRASIQTNDGAIIYISYRGILTTDSTTGETTLLTTPYFETASPQYAWINNVVAIGKRIDSEPNSVKYDIFRVK